MERILQPDKDVVIKIPTMLIKSTKTIFWLSLLFFLTISITALLPIPEFQPKRTFIPEENLTLIQNTKNTLHRAEIKLGGVQEVSKEVLHIGK